MSTELLIKAPASCGVVTAIYNLRLHATKGGLAEEKSDSISSTKYCPTTVVVLHSCRSCHFCRQSYEVASCGCYWHTKSLVSHWQVAVANSLVKKKTLTIQPAQFAAFNGSLLLCTSVIVGDMPSGQPSVKPLLLECVKVMSKAIYITAKLSYLLLVHIKLGCHRLHLHIFLT